MGMLLDPAAGDGGVSAFYQWTDPLPTHPGVLLRFEDLAAQQSLDGAARNIRVLYSSTDGVRPDHLIAVSGAVYLPRGTKPKQGWPVVAWAHGTTGIADVCAPSWRGRTARDQAYLNAWLKAGFAVVATDYQGLGTPGVHPYLLWRSEGYSVLDSVRAALRQFSHDLQNKVIIVGQSQGSGAALGATWLSADYAPHLHLTGTIATGLVVTFQSDGTGSAATKTEDYTDPRRMDPSFAMLRVAGTDLSLHPGSDIAKFVSERGRPLLEVARTGCLHDMFALSAREKLSGADIFESDLSSIDSDMEVNFELPSGHMPVPVFVGTGLADSEAGTGGQYDGVMAMCRAGSAVEWHRYPGLTHNGAVNGSLQDSLPFARAVMAGEKTLGNCADASPPGPVQAAGENVPFNN